MHNVERKIIQFFTMSLLSPISQKKGISKETLALGLMIPISHTSTVNLMTIRAHLGGEKESNQTNGTSGMLYIDST